MKLKFEAQISAGNFKIYEESNINTPLYEVNVETGDKEHFKMKVSDENKNLLAQVIYKENVDRKWLMVNDYIIDNFETKEQINVKAQRGQKLIVGKNNEMYLTRSPRDRKMQFYKNDKLIMTLKCKTIIRNWLKGKYIAEILDEGCTLLCVCVIAITLNVIFDEHNCTSYTV